MSDDPATFLRVPLADGGTWTRLDRLSDGRVMCCLCFGYFTRAELNQLPDGDVEDVCKPCAVADAEAVARPTTPGAAPLRTPATLSRTTPDKAATSGDAADIAGEQPCGYIRVRWDVAQMRDRCIGTAGHAEHGPWEMVP